jgi:hypothetical protein
VLLVSGRQRCVPNYSNGSCYRSLRMAHLVLGSVRGLTHGGNCVITARDIHTCTGRDHVKETL